MLLCDYRDLVLASGENVLLNSDNKDLIQKYVEQSVEMHTKRFKQAELCNKLKNLRVEFSEFEQVIARSDSAGEPKKQVKKLAPDVYKEFMTRKKNYQDSQHTYMEPLKSVNHELGALEGSWFALMKEYQNSLGKSDHTMQTRWHGKTQHNSDVRHVMGQLETARGKMLYAGEYHINMIVPASECHINVTVPILRWSSSSTTARHCTSHYGE